MIKWITRYMDIDYINIYIYSRYKDTWKPRYVDTKMHRYIDT